MKNNELQKLLNISLIDGRNRDKLLFLRDYFSEFALFKYRIFIETQYLVFLSKNTSIVGKLADSEINFIKSLYDGFTPEKALKIKGIEKKINHDVKAVEYYLAGCLKENNLSKLVPFVHFGLTSYDINIPAYGLILLDFKNKIIMEYLNKIIGSLKALILETKDSFMLAKTHGQPALPTTMGKELAVFYARLKKEIKILKNIEIEGKLTGAVGNMNALHFVSPGYDWLALSKKFIKSLGLLPNIVTTQILPYDNWLTYFDCLRRINSVLLGLSQDIWLYISFEYFIQGKVESEVGSSTMAHKINPITFENAEGNLQLANSLFEFFSRKLPVSRLQRDLSDSTVKRDFGLAFGFTILAWDSLLSGFTRIKANNRKMKEELDGHWEIYAEGIQTYLRLKGLDRAYDILKNETRGKNLGKKDLYKLIDKLPITQKEKTRLKIDDLSLYTGLTEEIIKNALLE